MESAEEKRRRIQKIGTTGDGNRKSPVEHRAINIKMSLTNEFGII